MARHAKNVLSYDLTATEAKAELVKLTHDGVRLEQALLTVGKAYKTYEYYRRTDKEFAANMDFARLIFSGKGRRAVGDFGAWSEKYVGHRRFWHQLQWVDLLEGRKPRNLHPAQIYRPADPGLIIVNTPPEHSKSSTLTIDYTVYRICDDPNIRVIIVSKTADMAKKFLYAIRQRLTHPKYQELQAHFAPPGGFRGEDSDGWRQDAIYLSGEMRDSGEKDPTVEARGIGKHIYGARADLVIMDDCVDNANAHEFEKQIHWIQTEVFSRIGHGGRLMLIGTRMAPQDLYGEIQNPKLYSDDVSPWTYFAQPAVLEFKADPKDWVTLWPRTNVPEVTQGARTEPVGEDGLYPKWDGPRLRKKRSFMSPRAWAMVYMQEQVTDQAVFPMDAVKGCISGRHVGLIPAGTNFARKEGMDGLYVVAGLDPAMTGHTAAVVMGVDRQTRRRHVLDVFNKPGCLPDDIRNVMKSWTDRFKIQEWRVEKNSFQLMLTQDREVREYLAARGCILKEHFTGVNKWDSDFGVASMAVLFEGWNAKPAWNLIDLPSTDNAEGVKALIEQLVTWYPETKGKTDCVMAMWFCEIRARELCDQFFGQHHVDNPYLSPRQREDQLVVDLDELATRQNHIRVGSLLPSPQI